MTKYKKIYDSLDMKDSYNVGYKKAQSDIGINVLKVIMFGFIGAVIVLLIIAISTN